MLIAVRVVAALLGTFFVLATLGSAVRTLILPRAVPARYGRVVFVFVRRLFDLRIGRGAGYARRDEVMAYYAPVALLALLGAWILTVMAGYMLLFHAAGGRSAAESFTLSGSSLFTLGFDRPADLPSQALSFSESAIGLLLVALLITYLPSIYAAFSRREGAVAMMEVRAGSPPSGVEMLKRFWRLQRMEELHPVWVAWEGWFVDVEETHTSFPALAFFRSPEPDRSWITAAGAVLDGAALLVSTVEVAHDVQADICIRSGYIAMRRICDFFGIPYNPNPQRGEPVSVAREEWEEACLQLEAQGLPLKVDREKAWADFSGWRVNYDQPLLALATLTMAPYAPWSSDRGLKSYTPSLFRFKTRIRDLVSGA
ncbi:MAG TPA: hypothetical protein VG245_07410 [Candidatus Dormibacteraeota bacterium]|jgi:hypothetical protein|nr:hypothetical protein [Candidatus Dormibacteraeota bacterium]